MNHNSEEKSKKYDTDLEENTSPAQAKYIYIHVIIDVETIIWPVYWLKKKYFFFSSLLNYCYH